MVATGFHSCHKCGWAANLITHRFQDGKTEFVFCQKCWASELLITEQSPTRSQTAKKPYPTAKKFVVITKENMEEIEPGAHLAYTMNKFGELSSWFLEKKYFSRFGFD